MQPEITREWLAEQLALCERAKIGAIEFIQAADDAARTGYPAVLRRQVELHAAATAALEHIRELREAWQRGAIMERDGLGGTRSNRNFEVELLLRKALQES